MWGCCQHVWPLLAPLWYLPSTIQHTDNPMIIKPIAIRTLWTLNFATPPLPYAGGTLDVRCSTCVMLTRWLRSFQLMSNMPCYGRNTLTRRIMSTITFTVNENWTSKTFPKTLVGNVTYLTSHSSCTYIQVLTVKDVTSRKKLT